VDRFLPVAVSTFHDREGLAVSEMGAQHPAGRGHGHHQLRAFASRRGPVVASAGVSPGPRGHGHDLAHQSLKARAEGLWPLMARKASPASPELATEGSMGMRPKRARPCPGQDLAPAGGKDVVGGPAFRADEAAMFSTMPRNGYPGGGRRSRNGARRPGPRPAASHDQGLGLGAEQLHDRKGFVAGPGGQSTTR
jgi:hypothetical protein